MAAPNLQTIFDVETSIEAAVVTILANQDGLNAKRQRGSSTVTTPWAGVQFVISGAPHFRNASPYYEDMWEGTLTIELHTHRQDSAAALDHASYRGLIRAAILDHWTQFTAGILPYHQVIKTQTQGNSAEFDDEQGHDMTVMNFALAVQVRPGAWPVGSLTAVTDEAGTVICSDP